MNLFHLRYFVELSRTQHYTKAAEHLCITQPSLSHAIHQLETELGVPLFEKNGRNTKLTQFGEQFLSYAEQSLQILDQGIQTLQLAAQGEGLIRLGFLRPLGITFLPTLTSQFVAANPNKEIHFSFHTGTTQVLLEGLAAHQYDLIFCSRPPEPSHWNSFTVGQQELVLIVPRQHPLAAYSSIDLQDTLSYPYIYFAQGSGVRNDVDRLFQRIGHQPNIAYEIEEDQVVAGFVARNFGIAIVPYMELLHRLDVSILRISNPILERNLYMVSDPHRFLSPVAQNFQSFVLQSLSQSQFPST